MNKKRWQTVTHPPPVIGQNAPEDVLAMRLSAQQLALPPRRIQTHTDGGAADSIRNVLHLGHLQG